MREIIFRGKRIDNGEWVEGYFVAYENESYIFEQNEVNKGIDLGGYLDCCQMSDVDPNTVGQYTGLKDKTGKRIFEGDIVEGVDFDAEDGYGVVEWYDGAFEVTNGAWLGTFHQNYYGADFEVIGNIHDNPELIGETE